MNDVSLVPHFIKASSAQALHDAMYKLQVRSGSKYDFYQIIFDGKEWFAWYYDTKKNLINRALRK